MEQRKSFIQKFNQFPNAVKLISIATLITNIGNGMNLLAVSKLVYDKTHSAMTFGGVIILQYIVMFLVQFLSGSIVDRNNPKKISITCDICRGILILSSGILCLFTNIGVIYLFISLALVNFINPFFSNANFILLPEIIKDKETLLRANSLVATLFQAGQLIGSACAAPIIYFFSPSVALIVDGLTFFVSALIFSFVKIEGIKREKNTGKNTVKNFFNDWKYIGINIKEEKSIMAHLLISSGDYIAVNFFNVMLVPMVILFYKNNSFCISLFDGGFAIGAMIVISFIVGISKKMGTNNSAVIGLLLEAMILMLLSLKVNIIFAFMLMILYGSANAFSLTIYNTNLQQRCTGQIKGRINSVKNFIVSCLTIILIPIITKLYDVSIQYGLLASSGILLIYALSSFLLGRKFAFGDDYLSKTINIKEVV